MPQSKKPRKQYRRPDYRAEAHRLMNETDALIRDPEFRGAPPLSATIHKDPPAPAHLHTAHPASAPRASAGRGRYLVAGAAGGAALGGAAYMIHRRRRQNVGKGLINPLTGESVVVEKRYPIGGEPGRGVLVPVAKTDETKLLHVGSRRGGLLPVSSVRTSGLPVQSATFSRGHTWERPGTSHENKLTHKHTKVKARRDAKLYHLKKNDVPGSGGRGRRIVSAY